MPFEQPFSVSDWLVIPWRIPYNERVLTKLSAEEKANKYGSFLSIAASMV